MNPTSFRPFYEHITARLVSPRFGPVLAKIVVSGLLGLLFFVPHAISLSYLPVPTQDSANLADSTRDSANLADSTRDSANLADSTRDSANLADSTRDRTVSADSTRDRTMSADSTQAGMNPSDSKQDKTEVCVWNKIICGWSWLLAMLISCAMACLYYATWTLNQLLKQMKRLHVKKDTTDCLERLHRILSTRNFILVGVCFGVLNALMGYFFGVEYVGTFVRVTLFGGFFLAGFVNGMAALGIYGVAVIMYAYTSKEELNLDYSAPDQCGGTYVLGEAFVKFSVVTLITGLFIAVYIFAFPWKGKGDDGLVEALRWIWLAYPFIMSLIVLFAPAAAINRVLRKYKIDQEEDFKAQLRGLRKGLTDTNKELDEAQRDTLRQAYDYKTELRRQLFAMRTWPFSISASVSFTLTFLGSAASQILIIEKIWALL